LLLYNAITDAIESAAAEFHFLRGDEKYKHRWNLGFQGLSGGPCGWDISHGVSKMSLEGAGFLPALPCRKTNCRPA